MKEGSAISNALLQLRPPKLTGNQACLHRSPSNNTLATLPRESIRSSPVEIRKLNQKFSYDGIHIYYNLIDSIPHTKMYIIVSILNILCTLILAIIVLFTGK